jgi:hypothetical protein
LRSITTLSLRSVFFALARGGDAAACLRCCAWPALRRGGRLGTGAAVPSHARHSGAAAGGTRNPVLSLAVIPAQAGLSTAELVIHFDLVLPFCFQVQSFHSPCGRAGNFLDSGHPALRGAAASFAVRAAPAAQCLCKESHQRNTPPVARSPGILPSDFASGLRGSLAAR